MVFLLAHVEVESMYLRPPEFSLQSSYRPVDECHGGNLLNINDCTRGLCAARLDGWSTYQTEASKGCYNATVRVNTCYQIAER